jgi:hypothetical protein
MMHEARTPCTYDVCKIYKGPCDYHQIKWKIPGQDICLLSKSKGINAKVLQFCTLRHQKLWEKAWFLTHRCPHA